MHEASRVYCSLTMTFEYLQSAITAATFVCLRFNNKYDMFLSEVLLNLHHFNQSIEIRDQGPLFFIHFLVTWTKRAILHSYEMIFASWRTIERSERCC